jgi:hypothetical protein
VVIRRLFIFICMGVCVAGCEDSATGDGSISQVEDADAVVSSDWGADGVLVGLLDGGDEPPAVADGGLDGDGDAGAGPVDATPDVEVEEPKEDLGLAREAFFALDNAHLMEITLSEFALQALEAEPYEYVPGDVTVNGEIYGQVGVRLKGKWGSFRPLPEKSAFLLNFAKYDNDIRLFGMKKLALNNQVQDASRMHEWLAYTLFRAAGLPASRLTYTWVRLNEADFGLYAALEVVDNPHFLKAFFADNDGQLYEGEYGTDLFGDKINDFDHDGGAEDGKVALYELAATLDAIDEDPQDALAKLGEVIDMDAYLAFAATEIWLGHWDGYAWTRNNYFIYRPEADELRWTWIPWGLDQTFEDHLDPFGGEGRISQLCNRDDDCRVQLGQHLLAVSERAQEQDLLGKTYVLEEQLWGAMTADPLSEHGEGAMSGSIEETRSFLQDRAETILDGLECLNPDEVDQDGDGFSGCEEDCDDGDPSIFPGAPELCNFSDDNCNGEVDEGGDCPTCIPETLNGVDYLFCFVSRTFEDAEADCVAKGGHLASIHDEATHVLLWDAAVEVQGASWWFGLHDTDTEGEYVWTDGTPFDFEDWGDGEPNDDGGEDCVHWADWNGGHWNDMPCSFEAPYLCQL